MNEIPLHPLITLDQYAENLGEFQVPRAYAQNYLSVLHGIKSLEDYLKSNPDDETAFNALAIGYEYLSAAETISFAHRDNFPS